MKPDHPLVVAERQRRDMVAVLWSLAVLLLLAFLAGPCECSPIPAAAAAPTPANVSDQAHREWADVASAIPPRGPAGLQRDWDGVGSLHPRHGGAVARTGILHACSHLLSGLADATDGPTRLGTCVEVGERARTERVDVAVVLALAWREAKFVRLPSEGRGVRGPLQIAPRWHCPGRKADGCDLVLAGVRLLGRLLLEEPTCATAIGRWNGGPKWRDRDDAERRGRWAAGVCREARLLRRAFFAGGEA